VKYRIPGRKVAYWGSILRGPTLGSRDQAAVAYWVEWNFTYWVQSRKNQAVLG
jgi:hypothetical protein